MNRLTYWWDSANGMCGAELRQGVDPQAAKSKLAACEDICYDDVDVERISIDCLRELAEADKDGRCGVCPVKLHQHIYRAFNGNVLDEIVCNAMFEPFTPRPRWKIWTMGGGMYYWGDVFGKTVFLTREAAEAALEAQNGHD